MRSLSAGLVSIVLVLGAGPARAGDEIGVVEVPTRVAERLRLAQEAIRFAKTAIPHAGNQRTHLRATEGRSMARVDATREQTAYTIGEVAGIVACTRGGNCGENADLAAHYLAAKDIDDDFGIYHVTGFDHAFVLIGDPKREPPEQVVVADPWVVDAEPVLWSDHFAYPISKSFLRRVSRERTLMERGQVARRVRRSKRNALRRSIDSSSWENPVDWEGKKGIWNHRSPFAKGKKVKYVESPAAKMVMPRRTWKSRMQRQRVRVRKKWRAVKKKLGGK